MAHIFETAGISPPSPPTKKDLTHSIDLDKLHSLIHSKKIAVEEEINSKKIAVEEEINVDFPYYLLKEGKTNDLTFDSRTNNKTFMEVDLMSKISLKFEMNTQKTPDLKLIQALAQIVIPTKLSFKGKKK